MSTRVKKLRKRVRRHADVFACAIGTTKEAVLKITAPHLVKDKKK